MSTSPRIGRPEFARPAPGVVEALLDLGKAVNASPLAHELLELILRFAPPLQPRS